MSDGSTLVLGVQGLLAVGMVGEGAIKLVPLESQVEGFEEFGYPQWFRVAIGVIEALAAVGLVVGLVVSGTIGLVSGLVVAAVTVGALASHIRIGDSIAEMVPAVLVLGLALVVVGHHAGVLV